MARPVAAVRRCYIRCPGDAQAIQAGERIVECDIAEDSLSAAEG
jgi:hypothetical protein